MTILFAGTELDAFSFTTPPNITTDTNRFNNVYVRNGMELVAFPLSTSKWTPPVNDETWFHFDYGIRVNSNGGFSSATLVDDAGVGLIRMYHPEGNPMRFERWTGSAWVSLATVSIPDGTLYTVDIQYKNTASGRISAYVNNYLVFELLGDFSASADAVQAVFVGRSNQAFTCFVSQVVVADECTIGFKLAYRPPNAQGNYNAWTGTFADVNETGIDDSTAVSSDTADQRESFLKTIFNVPASSRVRAVGITARARRGVTGLSKLALMLRFGSTDYDSPDKTLELGVTPVQHFWATNPATSLPWVSADAGSATLEFGLKART